MNTTTWVIMCSMIIKSVFVICVTLAAIYFMKPSILWWYLLVFLLGWEYKRG